MLVCLSMCVALVLGVTQPLLEDSWHRLRHAASIMSHCTVLYNANNG